MGVAESRFPGSGGCRTRVNGRHRRASSVCSNPGRQPRQFSCRSLSARASKITGSASDRWRREALVNRQAGVRYIFHPPLVRIRITAECEFQPGTFEDEADRSVQRLNRGNRSYGEAEEVSGEDPGGRRSGGRSSRGSILAIWRGPLRRPRRSCRTRAPPRPSVSQKRASVLHHVSSHHDGDHYCDRDLDEKQSQHFHAS